MADESVIKTISDFFYTVEKEVAELRKGEIELPIARAITAKRSQQVKLIALDIQNRRIIRMSPDARQNVRLFGVSEQNGAAKKEKRKTLN